MKADDDKPFAVLLGSVYELYNRTLSAAIIAMWWEALSPYDLAAVREALNRHAMNPDAGQFIPKPADVVRELGGTTADVSALAWAKVVRGARDFGCYDSVAFDDPLVHQTLDELGGWTWFGRQTTKEMPFIEKRFKDSYRAYLRRGLPADARQITHLPGIIEEHNSSISGAEVQAPKLIGHPARAKLIASGGLKIEPGWEFVLVRAGQAAQLEQKP